MPPRTTKRRTTTNLETKNDQNCQKIELLWKPDNQGVKEETFFRLVGGVETGGQGREDSGRGSLRTGWVGRQLADQEVPHSCTDKP